MRRLRARKKPEETPVPESWIRLCVVSRDPALLEEVHKDLMVGFLTRSGYDFESDHPDFQQHCDVLFLDLRAAGLQAGPEAGLAFIDRVRKSVSHPPIVALCDADAADFAREMVQHGAYDKLSAPLNMSQLRLTLQRAYDFRCAEAKLETFLSQETAARERIRNVKIRKAGPAPHAVLRRSPRPSKLAVGFMLGCVIFFAGLVAVRTILVGMGDALASAGFPADANSTATAANPDPHGTPSSVTLHRPQSFAATADFLPSGFDDHLSNPPAGASSSSGYEPASVVEKVEPRYSANARARHLQGTVRIRALITKDGRPSGLARVSGDPALAGMAMEAIALWRYQPATVDGNPVESEVIIPVEFTLPN